MYMGTGVCPSLGARTPTHAEAGKYSDKGARRWYGTFGCRAAQHNNGDVSILLVRVPELRPGTLVRYTKVIFGLRGFKCGTGTKEGAPNA